MLTDPRNPSVGAAASTQTFSPRSIGTPLSLPSGAYLNPGDIVFFYHKWVGLVAAGEVRGPVRQDGDEEQYRDVRFLTPVPDRQSGFTRAMAASDITKVTGRNFFWARTIKVPYLDREEAQKLVSELNLVLSGVVSDDT